MTGPVAPQGSAGDDAIGAAGSRAAAMDAGAVTGDLGAPHQVPGTVSGHHAVDAAVRAVINAAPLPIGEQLAAYEGAHETLREVLASIEE